MQVLLAENEIVDVKRLVRNAGTSSRATERLKYQYNYPPLWAMRNCRAGRKGWTEIACEPGLQEFHEPVSASWDREMIRDCGGKRNFSRGRTAKSTFFNEPAFFKLHLWNQPIGQWVSSESPSCESWQQRKQLWKLFIFFLLYWVKCVSYKLSSISKPLWRSGAGLFFFLKLLNPGPDTQCETIVTLPFEPVYSSIKKK